jgi:hypothetical protein
MRTHVLMPVALWASCSLIAFSTANAIENDRNKDYRLTDKHGPWMVMVATFRDVRDESRKTEGLSAQAAASELVHELREKGIPAYSYSQDAKKESIETFDRLGNRDKRVYAAQHDMYCVLAGNYEKVEDPVAQKTLAYVKRYRPKFMSDPKAGAVVRDPKGAKGPFAGAFLTINPLKNPDEIVRQKADSVTKYLNSGIDFALVNVKQKYTLKVATFTGKSAIPLGSSRFNGKEASFEKELAEAGPNNLARAGEDAAQLTYALRQNSAVTQSSGFGKFEAYVYHDKFQSMVTIGGFDRMDDPEIKRVAEVFHAKYEADEQGHYDLRCTTLILPNPKNQSNAKKKLPPLQTWVFDPVPELIEVPRIK